MLVACIFLVLIHNEPPIRSQPIANPGCLARLPNPRIQMLEDKGPDDKPVKLTINLGTVGKTICHDKDPVSEKIVKAKNNAGYVKARIFVHNRLQYSVMIVTPNEKELDDDNARKFNGSFKLKTIPQRPRN